MRKYELIVIWDTGEKTTEQYNTEAEAREIEDGFYRAFGKQIQWTGINEVNV